jgi:hypothetical protein
MYMTLFSLEQLDTPAVREFLAVSQQIDKANPDPGHLQHLRRLLAEHSDLWQVIADLAHEAALNIIDKLDSSHGVKEALKQGWQALKNDLGYAQAPTLEQLLIDQVILSWLQLNITQCYYTDFTSQVQPLSALNYWEKRLSAAQSRYLRACQALVQTRKLLQDRRPTVPACWYL